MGVGLGHSDSLDNVLEGAQPTLEMKLGVRGNDTRGRGPGVGIRRLDNLPFPGQKRREQIYYAVVESRRTGGCARIADEAAVDALAQWVGSSMPPGDLNDLITRGAIAGVGSVVIFLPQICLLFLFIGLLEDTGYMSRAAFLMDRLMSRVGLHGKSFIPMLSSFACAIPGIMATRTIANERDRMVTILIAPLNS
jgi:hypothetical protein